MERQSLADLLSEQENVCRLARSAVLAGAKYEIWKGVAGIDQLRTVFGRRYRTVRRVGQPSVGFAEAVEALDDYEGTELAMGYVDDRPQGGYYYQLFLTPDLAQVVACLGVEKFSRRQSRLDDDHPSDPEWQ